MEAVKEEKAMDQGEERMVPVFTVLKNGAILKNIFVVNSSDSPSPERNGGDDHELEEILIVGRHPDCNIMLTHPSISRFHLEIRSIPSRQKLSVTDLSSVHGTWVSDQKIEAGTCVEVKEGDTIRIGGSTRIYRLHWIPLRRAYDMDNQFVSPLDIHAAKEQEEENRVLNAENVEVSDEDWKLVLGEDEAPQQDWTSDGTGSSIPSKDPESIVKETSSLPLVAPSESSLVRDSSKMREQLLPEDAQDPPDFVRDILQVEAEISKYADNESLHQEDNGETEVVSRQVMDVSSGFFSETEQIKPKDNRGPVLGWQPLSEIQSELVNEVDNQSPCYEDNREYEVVSKQVMAVSAPSFTATEPFSETKTEVIQNQFLSWQPWSEIQSELAPVDENQSLNEEGDGEIDVVSRQVMAMSSSSFLETKALLETKNEETEGLSLGWQPLPEIQSELAAHADNKCLKKEDDVVSGQGVAAYSCSLPKTEPISETRSKYIEDPILSWQPLSQIQSEVKPTGDQNRESGMTGETEEPLKPNNLLLSKGREQSKPGSSLSATNQNTIFQHRESVMDIAYGGGSEETYNLNGLESHQNNEKTGFITATLAAEESARFLQPAEDILSHITRGKENQRLRSHARGVISKTENLRSSPLESAKRSSACNTGSRRGQFAAVPLTRTQSSQRKVKRTGGNCKAHLLAKEAKNNKSISTSLHKENLTPSTHIQIRLQEIGNIEESESSSFHAGSEKLEPEIFTPDKENLTPNTHIMKRLQEIGDIKESKSSSLHAGSEKQESEIFTPDKENLTSNAYALKTLQEIGDPKESKSSLKATSRPASLKIPFSNRHTASEAVLEPEIFTPDKENLTPNSLMLKRLQEVGKLQGNKDSPKSRRKPFSSKVFFSPDIHSEENIVPEEKKNQSTFSITRSQTELKHEQVLSKRKPERVPFQTLLENSSAETKRQAESSNAAARNFNIGAARPYSILSNGHSKMKWTIVVDISSFLDRGSRKSLQLLQGLKGTQLVIPRTVVRELEEQNRSRSLFFRSNKKAVSSAIEWIQECMVKTKWWVHLQSSSEETGPMAPTPPASAFPYLLHRAEPEIVSPTSEDNVLECALLYRKINSDGQFVLLSNDVTLKIKAMAEGVMCETAEEFHESIVNPFSERFMWAESSPRGQTWCHLDDIVLRERYINRSLSCKKGGESSAAKGLKLILLHNSHYGHNKFIPSN
ncbi:PREDICTED: FHA domain-containing protein PS1 [Tarenaya hassleriana]|uniref:FHA domain-containing protein PS1 n=1 Tax=Tarenaya hassleriana TaxID=28532 RepID=UPI00053C2DA8|nr:PREDICTED: FHA domain-containing protein PS1 [Tarenaya hassleriana]